MKDFSNYKKYKYDQLTMVVNYKTDPEEIEYIQGLIAHINAGNTSDTFVFGETAPVVKEEVKAPVIPEAIIPAFDPPPAISKPVTEPLSEPVKEITNTGIVEDSDNLLAGLGLGFGVGEGPLPEFKEEVDLPQKEEFPGPDIGGDSGNLLGGMTVISETVGDPIVTSFMDEPEMEDPVVVVVDSMKLAQDDLVKHGTPNEGSFPRADKEKAKTNLLQAQGFGLGVTDLLESDEFKQELANYTASVSGASLQFIGRILELSANKMVNTLTNTLKTAMDETDEYIQRRQEANESEEASKDQEEPKTTGEAKKQSKNKNPRGRFVKIKDRKDPRLAKCPVAEDRIVTVLDKDGVTPIDTGTVKSIHIYEKEPTKFFAKVDLDKQKKVRQFIVTRLK